MLVESQENCKPATKAPFYEELDLILGDGDKPCTRPLTIVNSMQIAARSLQNEKDDKGDESFNDKLQRLKNDCIEAYYKQNDNVESEENHEDFMKMFYFLSQYKITYVM